MKRRRSRLAFSVFALFVFLVGVFRVAVPTSSAGQMGRGNLSSLAPQLPTPTREEQLAFKSFTDETSPDQKIRLGEDFDENFPHSQYAESVDTSLTFLYFNKQAWSSFYAEGDRVIAINPKSTVVLELV